MAQVTAPPPAAPVKSDKTQGSNVDLKSIVPLLDMAVSLREPRLMARAIRQLMLLRPKLKVQTVAKFLRNSLGGVPDVQAQLLSYLTPARKEMEVDSSVPDGSPAGSASTAADTGGKVVIPELEIFSYLLVLIFLIDQKLYNEAKACSSSAVKRLQQLNRRTLDLLAARLYSYYSLSYERTDALAEIRSTLLALHRTATLRHDDIGQETLLNLLLRNYLHYNLYDQAEKLRSKTQQPELHSNHQFCRYLFYLGRIRTIQLEYTAAKDCLEQAARKAPQAARGFRILCNKWASIVRLLLGEIPDRNSFMQPGMRRALQPYFELTNAVRIGDLGLFHSVADKYAVIFKKDKTHNLIVRLRHNVIRTGLRRINLAYSRISLADIGVKLNMDGTIEGVECIVMKAIRDGGIDATVDHSNGWMRSKETGDIYTTQEPQAAFHARILFCLNMHNESVRALRFPPDAHRRELESPEERRERQQQEQELANHIAEDDDDDF